LGELVAQLLQLGAELVLLNSMASELVLKVGQSAWVVPDAQGHKQRA
jgi:hypothetical protein